MKRVGNRTVVTPEDDSGRRFFRLVIMFSIGIVGIMILASLVTFFLTIEGEEQTLVPDVRGLELANAMIELQQKGLVGNVQLRVSANPQDKGSVLGQEPNPGTLVKVGREIELRVSKGPVIDEVEDYVNMKLSELRLQLQSMSTIYGPLLTIRDPVMEVYDEAPAGTILAQDPEAGTRITEFTELELVVSRGPQGELITIPDFTGMPFYEALREYSKMNAPFVFTSRATEAEEEPGTVVTQSPAAGSDVEEGTLMVFTITAPDEIEEGYVFGILEERFPDYPVPIDLFIEVESPDGGIRTIASMKHPGGFVSIPYLEPDGSEIIVATSLRELLRFRVQAPEE